MGEKETHTVETFYIRRIQERCTTLFLMSKKKIGKASSETLRKSGAGTVGGRGGTVASGPKIEEI